MIQNRKRSALVAHVREEIDHWIAKFPEGKQRSAVIARCMRLSTRTRVPDAEHMNAVADYLELPPIQVYEVARFYSMFEIKAGWPSQMLRFARISRACCAAADDRCSTLRKNSASSLARARRRTYSILKQEEECLAACCGAPMMMVDHDYSRNLTTEKVDEILDGLD